MDGTHRPTSSKVGLWDVPLIALPRRQGLFVVGLLTQRLPRTGDSLARVDADLVNPHLVFQAH